MNNKTPLAKIELLRNSLRCFGFSLAGLVPLIGLPFAIASLVFFRRVRAIERNCWNAARHYSICGAIFGSVGFLVSLILLWLIVNRATT